MDQEDELTLHEHGSFMKVRQHYLPENHRYDDAYGQAGSRLTWGGEGFEPGEPLRVQIPGFDAQDLLVNWIDAILLPGGAGSLVMSLELPDVNLMAAAALLRYLKKIEYRRRLTVLLPELEFGGSEAAHSWAEKIGTLLAALPVGMPSGLSLKASEFSGTLATNWRIAISAAVVPADGLVIPEPFARCEDYMAFALSTGRVPVGDPPTNLPGTRFWEELARSSLLQVWSDWSMLLHYDNLTQAMVSDSPEYCRQQFENFEYEYMSLFLLATAQRHMLDVFEVGLAQIGGELEGARSALDKFNRQFARFSNRLFNIDVSTTPVGKPLYSMLRRSLNLDESFDSIVRDAERLEAHLASLVAARQVKSTKRMQATLELLVFVGFPTTLLVSLLAARLTEVDWVSERSASTLWWILVGTLALSLVAWAGLRSTGSRDDDDF